MNPARTLDIYALDRRNKEISEKNATLRQRTTDSKTVKDNVSGERKVYNEWTNKFPHRTRDLLLEYAKSVGTHVVQYYNDLLNHEDGDNYHMRKAATVCENSDPMFLKDEENEIPRLHNLIDDLVHFRYEKFAPDFLNCLKKELPIVTNVTSILKWAPTYFCRNIKIDRKLKIDGSKLRTK